MGRTLASRCRAIMTTEAGACYSCVVKVDRRPAGVDMTGVTGIGGGNMCRALASSRRPVMTTEAGARCSGVVKIHRSPVGIHMTRLTGI